MVSPSLTGFGLTRRYNANPLPSQGVGHKQQPVFDHPNHNKTLLCGALAVIRPFESKCVPKHPTRCLEGNAVLLPIGLGLQVIPLEEFVLQNTVYQ